MKFVTCQRISTDDLWSTKDGSFEGNVSFSLHTRWRYLRRKNRPRWRRARVSRLRFAFHAFPISRFAFPHCFVHLRRSSYVARKHAHPFTSKNRFRTAIKLCLSRSYAMHAILISAIRLWSLVSTKNIYNILNSNDRYVDSWFKNLNKLIHYIYYITYIVLWEGRGEGGGRAGEDRSSCLLEERTCRVGQLTLFYTDNIMYIYIYNFFFFPSLYIYVHVLTPSVKQMCPTTFALQRSLTMGTRGKLSGMHGHIWRDDRSRELCRNYTNWGSLN